MVRQTRGCGKLATVITFMFAEMVAYPWPITLAYVVLEPALEPLAEQTLEEGFLDWPHWVGLFYIVTYEIEDDDFA